MKLKHSIFIIAVLISLYSLAVALPPGMSTAPKISGANALDTWTMIDVNNLQMFITNQGGFAEDWGTMFGRADGLYFPAGTEQHVLYSGGIWVGGKVGGQVRLAVGAFDTPEYIQGPIDETNPWGDSAYVDNPRFKVYKIVRDSSLWLNPANATDFPGIEYVRSDSAAHWDDYDLWQTLEVIADGAPLDTNDLPLMIGDQTLWCVFNDYNINDVGNHTYTSYGGGTAPLGVELQSTYWAYNLGGALGNTIFVKWIIINKSDNVIDSCYVSLWADPDLGGASDDLVGCDTTLSLGYCYNATNNDNVYNERPPAVGYDFLQGPIIRETDNDPIYASHDFSADTVFLNTGDTIPQAIVLGMSSFNKYINGTDPDVTDQAYGYMKGFDAVESCPDCPYINPTTGLPTAFFGSGNPVTGTGWNDDGPADRRYMQNTGPFTFNPGDTQIVVAAIVVGQGADRKTSVSVLKAYDELAQFTYDVNFDIPLPPPQPVVTARAYNRKVVLTWGDRSETDYVSTTHQFEGYVVYQGETVAGPWTPIQVFDVVDGEALLFDNVIDPNFGVPVFQPVIAGSDAGIEYEIEITEDAVVGGPLHNGLDYYFAVTAYSYPVLDPESVPKGLRVLNGRPTPVVVTPQDDPMGTEWATASVAGDTATYSRIDNGIPPTTDFVLVEVIDESAITGHDYQVRFIDAYPDTIIDTTLIPPDTELIWPDTVDLYQSNGIVNTVHKFWEVWDVTTGEKRLKKQYNKAGDDDYLVVDGVRVKVFGEHSPALVSVTYMNNNTAHDRGLSWVDWGAPSGFFGNSTDYGINFWGGYLDPSTMADSFATYEVRFVNDIDNSGAIGTLNGQWGYSYIRGGTPNYGYDGYFQIPVEAYEIIAGVERQVNICYVEWNDPVDGAWDSVWTPTSGTVGGREYFFLLKTDYDGDGAANAGTGSIDYTTEDFFDGSTFDFVYAGWWRLRGSGGYIDSGDVMEFLWANPADENDLFSYSTSAPDTGNLALGENQLENIRVVPNPYYAYSRYEPDQFKRQVRFLGVPEQFTIRIFNLAGDKVRTLYSDDIDVKNAGDSWAKWNLNTDMGLPVASGIYIWYLESEKYGSTYGKMAIFPEVEQLNTY